MISTDFEQNRFELASKFCEKLGDDVVVVRAADADKKNELCMQSTLCGGVCADNPQKQSAEK